MPFVLAEVFRLCRRPALFYRKASLLGARYQIDNDPGVLILPNEYFPDNAVGAKILWLVPGRLWLLKTWSMRWRIR